MGRKSRSSKAVHVDHKSYVLHDETSKDWPRRRHFAKWAMTRGLFLQGIEHKLTTTVVLPWQPTGVRCTTYLLLNDLYDYLILFIWFNKLLCLCTRLLLVTLPSSGFSIFSLTTNILAIYWTKPHHYGSIWLINSFWHQTTGKWCSGFLASLVCAWCFQPSMLFY